MFIEIKVIDINTVLFQLNLNAISTQSQLNPNPVLTLC